MRTRFAISASPRPLAWGSKAVLLATPHSMHTAQIAQAVAAGKHIFCEKPLALTKADAETSVALCRDAGLVLGMGHERRWEPPVAEMLAMADAGTLGRIHQIEANFSHDKFLSLDRNNWRLKADQAPAGGMTATGIHLLDLSVRLLGSATSVLCICEQLSSDLPQGDTVAAFVAPLVAVFVAVFFVAVFFAVFVAASVENWSRSDAGSSKASRPPATSSASCQELLRAPIPH